MAAPQSSLLFFDHSRPDPATDDARVLSLALRTLCLLAVAAEGLNRGHDPETVMRVVSGHLTNHTMALFPAYGDGFDAVMELAKRLGLSIDLDLAMPATEAIQ